MGLFSLFLASCPLIEGRQREWNGREALASLEWNFSAAEGPPAHNPQINSFQLSPSAKLTFLFHSLLASERRPQRRKKRLICWLAASLWARWCGALFALSFSISFDFIIPFHFMKQNQIQFKEGKANTAHKQSFLALLNCFHCCVACCCLSSLCGALAAAAAHNPQMKEQPTQQFNPFKRRKRT